jgi:hypothetical protein
VARGGVEKGIFFRLVLCSCCLTGCRLTRRYVKVRMEMQRSFYAANLLRWEAQERSQPKATPVQSPFVRCKDARVMLGGRSIFDRCERAGWFKPVRRGKRLKLFKRDDIEAAQLRVSWGELP